ncbi:MAG: carbohydrate kinase family protein [Hyphomicrobiaceae bacterium]
MKTLTIGSAMIDTIAIIESNRIERMSMLNAETSYLLLAEGLKTEALEISTHCGGGAVNTAVSMARLGHDVATLVVLGRDQRAESLLTQLMQEGISTRWAKRDPRAATGASVLVSSHERNAAIFTFRGANTLLESADLKPDAFNVDLVHVSGLSNKSADCFGEIVTKAKAAGAFVSTNPGIRQLSSRTLEMENLFDRIDVLSVNRTEAAALVPSLVAAFGESTVPLDTSGNEPQTPLARHGLASGGYTISLRTLLQGLIRMGLGHVLVTDGAAGAYLASRDRIYFCPTVKTKVAGTAGAGDAFVSTLACHLAEGASIEVAMQAASLNAAAVVANVDTQTGLMNRAALDAARAARAAELPIMTWAL